MRKVDSVQWPALHSNGNSYPTEFEAERWKCPFCNKCTPRIKQHLATHKDLIGDWAEAENYCKEVALLKDRKRREAPLRKEAMKKAVE